MTAERRRVIAELMARANATGRKVYGYDSDEPGCELMPRGGIDPSWDRVCLEGDKVWIRLPDKNTQ